MTPAEASEAGEAGGTIPDRVALLDVNVLVALAWPNHVHHDAALRGFHVIQTTGWATCPATQSGFVRVSSNRKIVPEARTPSEAIQLLKRIVDLPGHHFWRDDVSIASAPEIEPERLLGYRQVTDAHLLALAVRRRGRLATFDRGVASLVCPPHEVDEVTVLLSRDS